MVWARQHGPFFMKKNSCINCEYFKNGSEANICMVESMPLPDSQFIDRFNLCCSKHIYYRPLYSDDEVDKLDIYGL